MQNYIYIGANQGLYTQVDGLPASLVVNPGDIVAFPGNPPTDGLWVPAPSDSVATENWFEENAS